MELPTWAYDEILRAADETPLKVALALYRYGSPVFDDSRLLRAHWRGPKRSLATLAGCSKRSLDAAIVTLVRSGLVREHRVTGRATGVSVSIAVHRDGGATVAPLSEPEIAQHVVVNLEDPDRDREYVGTNMLGADEPDRGAIVASLKAVGVQDAEWWPQRWPLRDIAAALLIATREGSVDNPGGFARWWLMRGNHASAPEPELERWGETVARLNEVRANYEAQREYVASHGLGHPDDCVCGCRSAVTR